MVILSYLISDFRNDLIKLQEKKKYQTHKINIKVSAKVSAVTM